MRALSVGAAFFALSAIAPCGGAEAVTFQRGAAWGAIAPTGPAVVAGSSMSTIGVTRVSPAGPADITVGMSMFPPAPSGKVPLRVLRAPGDGTLVDATGTALGGDAPGCVMPRQIISTDTDADGLNDLVIGCSGYDADPFSGEPNLLLRAAAPGAYSNRSSLLPAKADYTHGIAVGDVDGDGRADIYVGTYAGTGAIPYPHFLMANATGGYVVDGDRLPGQLVSMSLRYTACALTDVDNDGHLDLALGADADGVSVVLLNDGSGRFALARAIPLPPPTFGSYATVLSILPLDVNADGYPDLVTTQTRDRPPFVYVGGAVQVFVNREGRSFVDETPARIPDAASLTGPWIQYLQPVDIDRDGRADLSANALIPAPGSQLAVTQPFAWLDQGGGHYAGVDFSSLGSWTPTSVAMIDINADGYPDAVPVWSAGDGVISYESYQQENAVPHAYAELSAGSVAFPARASSPGSWTRSVTVSSTGTSPLAIASIAIGGDHPGDFTRGGTCTAGALPAGASCTMEIAFSPQESGARRGLLTLTSNAAGGERRIFLFGATPPAIPLGTALDQNSDWQTGGSAQWSGQAAVSHDGVDAARSGAVADGQYSHLSTVFKGPGRVSFWWKTSSEAGDRLRFIVDKKVRSVRSGAGDWQKRSFRIGAGRHRLKWEFLRDASGSAGENAGFLDQVRITR